MDDSILEKIENLSAYDILKRLKLISTEDETVSELIKKYIEAAENEVLR